MRLDHEVTFWLDDDQYDPDTHQYGDPKKVAFSVASVTDLGTNRSVELFGKYDQQAKVVRTVEPIGVKWSYLTVDDDPTRYVLQTTRVPLQNNTLIVGEENG
ncbi:MAG: hypothetical protein ABF743_10245 [Schleiferilactobacillus perolens]|uniref:hypothetical protein n=1 Tax=Schleiferilactobacillus perolens TaxID=100468 RepID=UPI0039EC4C1A